MILVSKMGLARPINVIQATTWKYVRKFMEIQIQAYKTDFIVSLPTTTTEQEWHGCYNRFRYNYCTQRADCNCKNMLMKDFYCIPILSENIDLSNTMIRESISKKLLFGTTLVNYSHGIDNILIQRVNLLQEKDLTIMELD